MDVKALFRKSRKFYLLVLLLLIFTVPVALSGCGGGGGGSSSSGASASINPNGTVSTSQTYNISGTVAGGSGNLSGVTVTLYVLNTANDSFSSTGDTTTTGNNGSYSLTYTGSGLDYFLVVVVTPSGNTLYNIAFGSLGVPNITMNIDELTTAQAVYAFQQAGGTMTSSGNGIPLGSISNYSQLYNDLPASPSNTYTIGFSHASVSPNLPSTAASEIETLADALASCVQSTSYCSSVKGNLPNYTSGDGMFIYILIGNYTNANIQTALNNLISAISSLNVPWTSPTPTSSSSTTTTTIPSAPTGLTATAGDGQVVLNWIKSNSATAYDVLETTSANGTYSLVTFVTGTTATVTGLTNGTTYYFEVVATNTAGSSTPVSISAIPTASSTSSTTGATIFTVGSGPYNIAIDSLNNVWVANDLSNTVTELSPSGAILGTYTVGIGPRAIAIDPSGNIWVANQGGVTVTELSPSGATLGTYNVGSFPQAIAIDPSGNIWVANEASGTITELSSSGTKLGTYSVGNGPDNIAIDHSGNVWVTNQDSNTVTELSPSGATLGTYNVGSNPWGIAIDPSGNIWVANWGNGTIGTTFGDSNVTELSPSGNIIGTYVVGSYPWAIAIDSSGNIWVANEASGTITELSSSGATLMTYNVGGNPNAIAIDHSGNVWVTNQSNKVAEFLSVAKGPQFFPYSGPQWP